MAEFQDAGFDNHVYFANLKPWTQRSPLSFKWNEMSADNRFVSARKSRKGRDITENYPSERSFYNSIWDQFDLNFALEELCSPSSKYFCYHQAIFSAFCAWLIEPFNERSRQSAIANTIGKALDEYEQKIAALYPGKRLAMDMIFRIKEIGPEFYENIYYPIGGIATLQSSNRDRKSSKEILKHYNQLQRLVSAMEILHFAAVNFDDSSIYNRPSKNSVVNAFKKVSSVPVGGKSERSIQPLWNDFDPALLFIYAAGQLRMAPRPRYSGSDFFEISLNQSIYYDRDVKIISEIVGRVRYLKSAIGTRASHHLKLRLNQIQLPNIKEIKFEPRTYSEKDTMSITEVFKRSQ